MAHPGAGGSLALSERVARVELGRVRDTYSHAESTAKVIENDPGAGVASVIHGGGGGGGVGEERLDAKKAPVLRPARRMLGGLWVDLGIGSRESAGLARP